MIRSAIRISAVLSIMFMLNGICYPEMDKSALTMSVNAIEKELNEFNPDPALKEDAIALTLVRQALVSIREGSFGIGACLIDEKDGKAIVIGHNELLLPYFRSDRHAEMVILDKYEDDVKGMGPKTEGLALYSSLEPCPMCTIRLLSANIKKVRYVSPDIDGGSIRHMNLLPPYWKDQIYDKDYQELQCSQRLKDIAHDLLNISIGLYSDRLK